MNNPNPTSALYKNESVFKIKFLSYQQNFHCANEWIGRGLCQRRFLKKPGLIADGRDMGNVVFPASKLKIYLTADQNERAKRRYNELKQKGINVRFAAVLEDLKQRDNQDKERNIAPLKVSPDSVLIDSTNLSVNEVVSKILSLLFKTKFWIFIIASNI